MMKYIGLLILLLSGYLYGHEGHHHQEGIGIWQTNGFSWLHWIGKYHYLILHFPIALITMTLVAEGLGLWSSNPMYSQAARFMLIASVIWVIPTALLGWALSYGSMYEGETQAIFDWHWTLGMITVILSIATLFFREYAARPFLNSVWPYYICLLALFITMYWTALLGTQLTFNF